jgi:hypothetical protein
MSGGRDMSGRQPTTVAVPHKLLTQVAMRQGLFVGPQSAATLAALQQPATPVFFAYVHWLAVHVAVWHWLVGQSVATVATAQQPLAFVLVTPQVPDEHTGVWQALAPLGHVTQLAPQSLTLVSDWQVLLHL